jgi:hypothetical protein
MPRTVYTPSKPYIYIFFFRYYFSLIVDARQLRISSFTMFREKRDFILPILHSSFVNCKLYRNCKHCLIRIIELYELIPLDFTEKRYVDIFDCINNTKEI